MLAVAPTPGCAQGDSRLTARMEAGVAVVQVGGRSLANREGAQHHSGRITHVEEVLVCLFRSGGYLYSSGRNVVQRRVAVRGWAARSVLDCERSDCGVGASSKTGVKE